MLKKVMIIIDTAILGGPGKGILQLLRHENSGEYSYIVCGFNYRRPKSTQFIDEARAAGCDLRLLPQRFKFDPTAILCAWNIARAEGVSIIQSHGYKAHVVAQVIARMRRIPWLAMTHGWTSESWKIRIYNKLERSLLKRASVAVTVSQPLFQEVQALRGPERPTRLITNAVDSAEIRGQEAGQALRARYGIPATACVIGIFGRLSPEKGVLIGLDAFAAAAHSSHLIHLLIVGEGQMREAITDHVCRIGIEHRVTLAGYQHEMKGYYEAINLLVIPSLSEGMPNVLLEAMSMGIPAVCTRVGAIPEIIRDGENGWLVEPGSSAALASQIELAIIEPSRLAAVGRVARSSLLPTYCADRRAAKFTTIYNELSEQFASGISE